MTETTDKTKDRSIETYRVTWQGIGIEIRFERNWLGLSASRMNLSHFDVESVAPPRAQLPITETGYRSIFTSPEAVDAWGGPVAYVTDALNDAAQDKGWKTWQAAQRQLSLF